MQVDPVLVCVSKDNFANSSKFFTITKIKPGNYSLKVVATTEAGRGKYSHYIYFYIDELDTNYPNMVVIGVVLVVLVV